jgi:ATP-dependent DNA ligase
VIPFGYPPMEMRAVAELPPEPGWQYEPKWDGFRCLAFRSGDDVTLQSKAGQPLARYFPEIVAALQHLGQSSFVLDGELVVPYEGALSFGALQQRIHPAASRVAMLAETTPAKFLAFDLLAEAGEDLIERPLAERRARLVTFAEPSFDDDTLRLSPATEHLLVAQQWLVRTGGALDGIIAKRLDAAYASGSRDAAVKVKVQRTADCVIGGFRYAKGSNERIGSLLLGLYDADGALDYIGFCSAFATAEREALAARVTPFVGGEGFSGMAPDSAPSRWDRGEERDRSYVKLRPELVLEVQFDQVSGGRMRHGARPLRWRTDKAPRQCTSEQLDAPQTTMAIFEKMDGGVGNPPGG